MATNVETAWPEIVRYIFGRFESRRMSLLEIPRAQVGSDLDRDREIAPLAPSATAAWLGLSMAGDHVFALYRLWLADGEKFFSEACFALVRPALVGASRALYVLSPDEHAERAIRALQSYRNDAEQMRRALQRTLEGLRGAPTADRAVELERETAQAGKYVDKLDAAIRELGGSARAPSETEVIVRAAATLGGGEPLSHSAHEAIWRMLSASSHGLLWQRRARGHRIERDGSGATLYSEPNDSDFGSALGVTYRIWERAWGVFEQRRGSIGTG